ncbi:MAG TPA: FAD-dependent oxidoreductase [Anaerolineales bacterium]|nr:FAD-dependent oxidoreductase [Anaerolineales bacterium]
MRYVIIGVGVAGISAAEAIRSVEKEDEIIMISNDPGGYYSRPGLAYYLSGEINEKGLFPGYQRDWIEKNVHLISGKVIAINPNRDHLVLQDGRNIPYDRLLLATGSYAKPLEIPGSDLLSVIKLDDYEDSKRIIKLSKRTRVAVVIGGGITALELVEGLMARNVKIHFLIRGERYWNHVLDEAESRLIEKRLTSEGVQIHYQSAAREIIEKKGKVKAVVTESGETIKCQMVAYAVGIQPNIDLAIKCGITTDRGILVNEYMKTDFENIYAAGDVAQVFDPFTERYIIDSLWDPARNQGYIAGLNMAGNKNKYLKTLPFNVTRLAGITTTIIGMIGVRKHDQNDQYNIVRGDSETFQELPDSIAVDSRSELNNIRMIIGEKTILGAIIMGDQTLSRPLKDLITEQVDISSIKDDLIAKKTPLADLVMDCWMNFQQMKR